MPDPDSGQAFIANGGTAIINGAQTSTFTLVLGEHATLDSGDSGNLLITNHGSLQVRLGIGLGAFGAGSITLQGSSSLQVADTLTFGFPSQQNGTLTVDGNSNASLSSTGSLLFQGGTSTINLANGGSFTIFGNAAGVYSPLNFSKKRSTGNDTDTGPDFGVLNIGTGAASGILNASVVTANNPNTLSQVNFNHSDDLTFGIPIEGTIKVSQIGTGTTTLTGTNTYSGGTTITAGTLQIGNGGTTGSIIGNVTNNGTLVFNRSDSVTFGGAISGTGNVTQNGAGVLILSGNNTYAGGTNIAAGVLSVGSDGNLGTGNLNVSNNAELLTTGALFTSTKAITLGTGGGTLASVTGGTGQYGGVISGRSPLSIGDAANAGTVILAADNTYTGGTRINRGTLQLGNGGATGSVVGDIADNGTLIVKHSNEITIPGTISGTGSVIKDGTNTLTLTGNNTYTGSTTIAAGTLQLGNGGTSGSVLGDIVNDGTLTVNRSDTVTLSRTISGAGAFDQSGTGTTILTGNNTYTGVTTIQAGTLQIGNGSTTGSIAGNVTDNSSLVFNRSDTLTFNGTISGTGSVTQNGAGELVLSGANTYSGGTTLNSGTLVVHSAQALGLGNVVVNRGVLRADPQPINVRGDYTQHAGGTLQLALAGSAPGQYDFLNVGGHATLDGTLRLISLNGFQPKGGDTFTLVIAGGGLSGQFASVVDLFTAGTRSSVELLYGPNTLVLEIVRAAFASFALTPNQLAVAKQIDKAQADPRETQLIAFLDQELTANLPGDFERISPDGLSALYEISFSAANVQASNLEERFAEIRNGSTGFSSSLSISNAPGTMVEGKGGKALIEPNKNVLVPSPENKWGVWISGSGDYVKVSGDGNGRGYDFGTGGVTFGLDYRLTKNLAVGIAGGYAHTWTDLTGSGKIDADSGRAGLYATYHQGGFYLGGYLGGGYNSYDTRRDALGGNAKGSTDGGEFDAYVGGGYEFHSSGFSFGPIASLQYTYVDVSGSTERGSLAPLRIESKSANSLRTNLGLGASYLWKVGKVQVTPSVRASWQHEYSYSALPIAARFGSGAGNVFTVHGPAVGHDGALIDAGVNVQWTPTIGTYFGYNGQVGRDKYDSQGGVCSVHWDF